ncbi:hypothetical protein LY90DRAFT_171627 [Neocallimastix californiae]|uniref:Uncharacterized protein n=1 Tax=Neocallimastix californiae TaxID=1754190 RepID=A0A1Y2A3D6_9FUNG|nr:hypothetical protein LY90DRAFT_171627 [Neocallimastix californiae]|eukprot:ORY17022.1 hypothetical protein LY90DRAFT_171627 [Neocallimastix californiae]
MDSLNSIIIIMIPRVLIIIIMIPRVLIIIIMIPRVLIIIIMIPRVLIIIIILNNIMLIYHNNNISIIQRIKHRLCLLMGNDMNI